MDEELDSPSTAIRNVLFGSRLRTFSVENICRYGYYQLFPGNQTPIVLKLQKWDLKRLFLVFKLVFVGKYQLDLQYQGANGKILVHKNSLKKMLKVSFFSLGN